MIITNKDLKLIIPLILFVTLGAFGMYSVDYISIGRTIKATFSYCLIPSIAISLYYAYFSTFGYNKVSISIWGNVLGFIAMTYVIFFISLFSFQGILVIINSKLGNQKEYLLSGKIIKLNYPEEEESGNKYSIEIEREFENDTIELNVPTNEYQIGHNFEKQMKIGSLNFIYSEN